MLDTVLAPLEYAVSWILIAIHSVLVNLGVPADSGWSWGPSVVMLVIVVRILLIPLFVKQIRAQRGLQVLQPKMAELRKKYGHDRQRMAEELQKLYKETGTNPFSSCLPILAQSPFFFGLFRVLDGIANDHERGVLTPELIASGRDALIFGAPLSDSFLDGVDPTTRIVTTVMIILMSASQFFTQRQIMMKNMPGGVDNPMAQQQKVLLYVFPLVFAVSGVYFPVGVLLYWLTTNLWTMGQQFYVIRRMPAPGSKAEQALQARRAAKGGDQGRAAGTATAATTTIEEAAAPPVRRQQPKKQTRNQRRSAVSPATPATPPSGSAQQPVKGAVQPPEQTVPDPTVTAVPNPTSPGRNSTGNAGKNAPKNGSVGATKEPAKARKSARSTTKSKSTPKKPPTGRPGPAAADDTAAS